MAPTGHDIRLWAAIEKRLRHSVATGGDRSCNQGAARRSLVISFLPEAPSAMG